MSEPSQAPLAVIGQYNLLEALPASGPGETYRARDTRHGRTVGIRILPSDFVASAEARRELIEGARPLVRMSHPNVTTLFDVGEHANRVYLVFEHTVGRSLRAEMAGGQLPPRRALEFAIHVAEGVSAAHALGFSHAGLSPDTITITTRGHAKIPAFHLAVREGFESHASGRLLDYASPEEDRGDPPDDRSDVYSVGAILYEMLTKRRPNPKGAGAPSAANLLVPPELDRLLLRAVSPYPSTRHESAAALAADMRRIVTQLDATGTHDDEPERASHPRRHRRPWPASVLLVAAGIAMFALLWWITRG